MSVSSDQTLAEIAGHIVKKHPSLFANLIPELPITEQTSIKFEGEFSHKPLSAAIRNAMMAALALQATLPEWLIRIEGMSGKKYRYFINNLVREISEPRYLEIGSWAGSTAASAIYGNSLSALCVDNWSQFGGPKDRFMANIEKAKGEGCEFRFIEEDFRSLDYENLNFDANIYLFDGPHEEKDQYDGVRLALPTLKDEFVLIVDDWNWVAVRNGTKQAISDCALTVQSCVEIRTTTNDSHPRIQMQNSDWHNGYFIAHIKK
jgi:SAM-dependent methyltransferase